MDKKISYIFLVSILVLSSFTTASSIGESMIINEEMKIFNYCSSKDCSYMNITTIQLPGGEILNLNKGMEQDGQTFYYNYTPLQTGEYIFVTCADPNGISNCESDTFIVNGGNMIIFIIVFIMFYLLTFIGIKIQNPWVSLGGCIGLLIVGIYTSINGVDIYRNELTSIISYITIMIGLGLGFETLKEITYL